MTTMNVAEILAKDADWLAEIRQLLDYDLCTGKFTWRPRPRELFTTERDWNAWNTRYAKKVAGYTPKGPKGNQYCKIAIFGELYYAHRLAWLWMTGAWPINEIDHKDCDKLNNRWSNLREATCGQNKANIRALVHKTTSLKGVNFNKKRGDYQAAIQVNRNRIHLGYFSTAADAHSAYCMAAEQHFGEFARTK